MTKAPSTNSIRISAFLVVVGLCLGPAIPCRAQDDPSPAGENVNRPDPSTVESDEQALIQRLIEGLVTIDSPDFGLASTMSGSQFAPVQGSAKFGGGLIMIDHQLKTSDLTTRLVSLGPKALPQLLRSLDDPTPSGLVIKHEGSFGWMYFDRRIDGNTANPRERRVLSAKHERVGEPGTLDVSAALNEYTVTRGDICFVLIGQIVNRRYQAVGYQPTAITVITSPIHDPWIAEAVRSIWASQDPEHVFRADAEHMLFESLLADFESKKDEGYAASAATRLLYYFPDQAASRIAERLDALDVRWHPHGEPRSEWEASRKHNRWIYPYDLIDAISFSDDQRVIDALLRVIERTDDPRVLASCLTEATTGPHTEAVVQRSILLLERGPSEGYGPFGGEYDLLRKAIGLFPDRARELFEAYLKSDALNARRAVCAAAEKAPQPAEWVGEVLAPLLNDRTDTGWTYDIQGGPGGGDGHRLVCDEAAAAIARNLEGASFVYKGERAALDAQILAIRKAIADD